MAWLDLGGALGLVQAKIAVPPLIIGQNVRLAAEDPEGKDHLAVKVHEPAPAQVVLVVEIDHGEVHVFYSVGVDLRFGEIYTLKNTVRSDPYGADLGVRPEGECRKVCHDSEGPGHVCSPKTEK